MDGVEQTIVIGTGAHVVNVSFTSDAVAMLNDLAGIEGAGGPHDHQALLMTIAVRRAASGGLHDRTILVDVHDIGDAVNLPWRSSNQIASSLSSDR